MNARLTLRSRLVLLAVALVAVGSAFFIACGSDATEPSEDAGLMEAGGKDVSNNDDVSVPIDAGADADAAIVERCGDGGAGTLDPTFGDGGVQILNYPGSKAYSVVAQPDGKLLVGGYTNRLAIVRLLSDGTPDPGFGTNGLVEVNGGGAQTVMSLALQADGKVLAAGTALKDFALVRLSSNGTPDPSFGDGGLVRTDISADDYASSVAVLAEGTILAGGLSGPAENTDFSMAKFLPNGTLDPTFGVGGRRTTDFRGSNDYGGSLVRLPTGDILAVGGSAVPGGGLLSSFALARYGATGALDTAFGDAGLLLTSDAPADLTGANAAVLDAAGNYVLVGTKAGTFVVMRIKPAGVFDTTFGGTGLVTTDFGGSGQRGQAIVLQADGKVIAVGDVDYGATPPLAAAVARYGSDGSLDVNFGVGGKVTTNLGPNYSVSIVGATVSRCSLITVGVASDRKNIPSTTYMIVFRYAL